MDTSKRLPTAFHEKFPMKRAALGQVVKVCGDTRDTAVLKSKSKREELLRERTSLGTNYVKSMPSYARGTGLLNENYRLTDFGTYALQRDPLLELLDTQWLMHYHMSAVQGPGPEYWHEFAVNRLHVGGRLYKSELREYLTEYFVRTKGKQPSSSTLEGVNAFVNTYSDPECLGKLGIITSLDQSTYTVNMPDPVGAWAFAYAMIDYWECNYKDRLSVNLNDLSSQNGLASLFLMDDSAINTTLSELQRAGFVDVYRSAHPYQVLLLSHDKVQALRNLYGVH